MNRPTARRKKAEKADTDRIVMDFVEKRCKFSVSKKFLIQTRVYHTLNPDAFAKGKQNAKGVLLLIDADRIAEFCAEIYASYGPKGTDAPGILGCDGEPPK